MVNVIDPSGCQICGGSFNVLWIIGGMAFCEKHRNMINKWVRSIVLFKTHRIIKKRVAKKNIETKPSGQMLKIMKGETK